VLWIVQQVREAWPYARAQKFLLFDRDAKFGNDVICAAKNLGTEPVRAAFRSPWQKESQSVGWGAAAGTCWIT